MALPGKKTKVKPSAKKAKTGRQEKDGAEKDPNAVHDIYTEDDLDPAYDKTIADDIAFDNDDE